MSDDKNQTGGPDRQRISLSDDYEVRDWSQKCGESEERLRAAVGKVGNMSDDVERELRGDDGSLSMGTGDRRGPDPAFRGGALGLDAQPKGG